MVIRYGVKALERKGKTFIPTHHYAKCFNTLPTIELDYKNLRSFLSGDSIMSDGPFQKGYYVLQYANVNVGLVKYSDNVLKNLYPKGLRFKID